MQNDLGWRKNQIKYLFYKESEINLSKNHLNVKFKKKSKNKAQGRVKQKI